MTNAAGSVVPETSSVREEEFHDAMVSGLARAQRRVGQKPLAFVMDMTVKQLRNILGGSSPHPKRMWDALGADPTVLDDVADLYGRKIVSKDLDTSADLGTLPLATLLAKVAEAESPASPGGTAKTHSELLGMEEEIRTVHALTADWIERINIARSPVRAVP
ncbi:hypothetical protein OMP43_21745 [Sphingomonas sp. CBMAI 2297]|uniref:hypothetical protein n=1 Tax=Sphingomonas sp. CBMAI 2297 TaxID=2991720 RepID=UPI002453A6B9|nr:hypothetical protein [Sphingomonas sp. CBMAI 2297]MDH4746654.1 hypothetical protein [Sphingomonas sp. CBMAI 2297]